MFKCLFKHVVIGELRRHGVSTVDLSMGLDDKGGLWMKADYWDKGIIFKDGPVAFLSLLGELKGCGNPAVFWAAVSPIEEKKRG